MKQLILILLLIITIQSFAQITEERVNHLNHENGIAIQGYDPVAYFSNKAQKGLKKYATDYEGITYYFTTENNKNLFLKNPTKYEPQYGGWCAFAMGDYGKKVEINPETYKIVDGKLYLFYNKLFNNTLKIWNIDEKNLIIKAEKNWDKHTKK